MKSKKKPWTVLPPEEVTDFTEFHERMEKVRNGEANKFVSDNRLFKEKKEICGDDE